MTSNQILKMKYKLIEISIQFTRLFNSIHTSLSILSIHSFGLKNVELMQFNSIRELNCAQALVETSGWLNVVSYRNPHSERGLHVDIRHFLFVSQDVILYDVFSKPINFGPD